LRFSGSYQESLSHKLGRFGALSFWSRGRRATDGGERWNLRGAIQSLGEFSQRDGCRAIVNDYRAIKRRLTIGQPGIAGQPGTCKPCLEHGPRPCNGWCHTQQAIDGPAARMESYVDKWLDNPEVRAIVHRRAHGGGTSN